MATVAWFGRRFRSGRKARVAMMETADFGKLDDLAHTGRLDGSRIRRVLAEREMSSRLVMVGEVPGQNPTEMLLTEDNYVIETLSAYGAHKAFSVGILPGASAVR